MQDNNRIHRFVVPFGVTAAWGFALFLGANIWTLFNIPDTVSMVGKPFVLIFSSAVSAYFAFLFECVFIFIDCGAQYRDENFNGKIMYWVAGIIFHVFVTFGIIGWLMNNLDKNMVCFLVLWVVLFKLGISLMTANMNSLLSNITIRTVKSKLKK